MDTIKSLNNESFTSTEKDILERNKNFFSSNVKYIKMLLEIITGESNISIRIIDWFVANYSKKNNTFYKIKINGREELFYVNNEYKNQLNGYSKEYFDPFCRKKKIIYTYCNKDDQSNIIFLSSIGQLNFFQWAIRNKIITYVQNHINKIEEDMKETTKKRSLEKKSLSHKSANQINTKGNIHLISDEPDPIICSSDKIRSLHISSINKSAVNKSSSENKMKRQQLSRSVYDFGIKKSCVPIRLDFD